MPTLTVQLASGQEVLSDIFLDADSTLSKLADAAGAELAVASSRCVLLSPSATACRTLSGPPISQTATFVLVMDLPRVYAQPKGFAFATVKHDGSVVTWSDAGCGGDSDSVKAELTGGVDNIVGNSWAFAAVKQDGSVVTWGDAGLGGNSDEVRDQLRSCGAMKKLEATPPPCSPSCKEAYFR